MDLKVDSLAEELKLNKRELIDHINSLDHQLNLEIENYYELTQYQYDVVRSSLDVAYMAKRLKRIKTTGVKKGTTHDRTKAKGYSQLLAWLTDYDLYECSTEEIKESLPGYIPNCGVQTIATAMRELGYERKIIVLDNGKQGRRWIRDTPVSISFM